MGPGSAAQLSTAQVSAALKRARRRDITAKTAAIRAALRDEQLAQPPAVTAACAAVAQALPAVITVLNTQIKVMEGQVEAHFLRHPDAEIIMSQPGLGSTQPQAVTAATATTMERDVKSAPWAITVVRVMPRYMPTAATPRRSTRRPSGVCFAAVRSGCLRPKTVASTADLRVHQVARCMLADHAL